MWGELQAASSVLAPPADGGTIYGNTAPMVPLPPTVPMVPVPPELVPLVSELMAQAQVPLSAASLDVVGIITVGLLFPQLNTIVDLNNQMLVPHTHDLDGVLSLRGPRTTRDRERIESGSRCSLPWEATLPGGAGISSCRALRQRVGLT